MVVAAGVVAAPAYGAYRLAQETDALAQRTAATAGCAAKLGAVSDGRESTSGYRFGDITRGILFAGAATRRRRGGDGGYHFGDFTRGLTSATSARNIVAAAERFEASRRAERAAELAAAAPADAGRRLLARALSEEDPCPICLDALTPGAATTVELACGHKTCRECWGKLQEGIAHVCTDGDPNCLCRTRLACPLCRAQAVPLDDAMLMGAAAAPADGS